MARQSTALADGRPGASVRLRAQLKRLRSSLVMRCLACIIVYAALLAALSWGTSYASERLFDDAFPSMGTVLAYEDDLARDNFAVLQTSSFSRCGIIVFDDEGNALYSSSKRMAQKIAPDDLDMINEYGDQGFYEVYQEPTDSGMHYRILRCTYLYDEGLGKQIDAWCELDDRLGIIAGDLFAGRDALTQREFDFIQGVYSAQMSVERTDYQTADGQARTLVLIAPLVSEARYQQVVDDAGRLTLYAAPIALGLTIAAAWYTVRQVKRGIDPLDRAICASRRGETAPADAAGVPTELMGVYENFTDLMDELRIARDDQRRLIADISHDLKTPLTVIYGYAHAFCDGCVPPEKAADYHRAMAEKALAASELIDTFFAYAKMEHPEFAANLVQVPVHEAVRAVAADAEAQVEQAGCTLDVTEAEEERTDEETDDACAPRILLDRQLFRRMLLNLIGNACSHNPAGTHIQLSCSVDCARSTVEITVADTGTGISPEIAAQAFKPFVTSNTARSAGGGTGLGLTIARRCAGLMGGTLRCDTDSPAPWSTAFIIELPLARP